MAVVRGLVAVALLVGFYLLVAVVVLLYAALVVAVLATGQAAFQPTVLLAMIGLGVVVVVLVRAVARVSGAAPELAGVEVARPAPLWDVVDELAERVGTRAPDVIRLTSDANAMVVEEARLLGLVGGVRALAVGRPLLAALTAGELRAVIAHELGHYARGHTRLAPITYRGAVAMTRARLAIAEAADTDGITRLYAGLPLRLFSAYAWVYDRITLGARRRQELAADAAAARATSPQTTADGLRAAVRCAVAWADFESRFLAPAPTRPDDPVAAFAAMLADPGYRAQLAAADLPDPEPTWRDSHPSLRTRLAALARMPAGVGSADDRPATDLVALPAASRTGTPWREWVAEASARQADALAAPLLAALGPRPTLSAVLDLLASGRRDRIATRAAVTAVIGRALVDAGRATWSPPWTQLRLIAPDDIAERIAAAIDHPAEVPPLRAELSSVDLDAALPVPRQAAPPRPSLFPDAPRSAFTPVAWFVALVAVVAVLISLSQEDEEPVRPPYRPPYPTTNYLPPAPTFQPTLPGFPTADITLPTFWDVTR
ncbi:M48 family metalloprotease [Actinokineospora sp. NPDC004072]